MHGATSEPCTAYLAWKLDRGSQTSDHFQMILNTSQMLNLNMELLDHYIGSLKKFREKCGWAGQESVTDGAQEEESRMQVE